MKIIIIFSLLLAGCSLQDTKPQQTKSKNTIEKTDCLNEPIEKALPKLKRTISMCYSDNVGALTQNVSIIESDFIKKPNTIFLDISVYNVHVPDPYNHTVKTGSGSFFSLALEKTKTCPTQYTLTGVDNERFRAMDSIVNFTDENCKRMYKYFQSRIGQ